MIRLPLKTRVKLRIRRRISSFFYKWAYSRYKFLIFGPFEYLRKEFAPTYQEMQEDICRKRDSEHMVEAVRELVQLESVRRKIMLVDALPDDV